MAEKVQVAIIGSGPAGYTAGVYAARAALAPLLLAGEKSGGQLMLTTDVENYPGFAQGKSGPELMIEMRTQAERFGANILDVYATAVDLSQRPFKIWTSFPSDYSTETLERGQADEFAKFTAAVKSQPHQYEADALIIAVGATAKLSGVTGEQTFFGRGVSTCAVCDAAFYRDKDAVVIGGGDTAMEDTLALTKFAKTVTVVVRGLQLRASKVMQERVLKHPKVQVLFNTQIQEIRGEKNVTEIDLNIDGKKETRSIDGVFIAIGHTPTTSLFTNQLQLDPHGFIVTRHSFSQSGLSLAQAAVDDAQRIAFPSMTSVDGVFAAGDAVDIRYWQAVTAAAQGCMAAIDAERWLESR